MAQTILPTVLLGMVCLVAIGADRAMALQTRSGGVNSGTAIIGATWSVQLAQDVPQPAPVGTIKAIDNRVTLRLVNKTGETIVYEALGNTAPRRLVGNGTATLQNLRLPTSLTFNYLLSGAPGQDKLISLNYKQDAKTSIVEVVLTRTMDLQAAYSYLGIGRTGSIYLY